MRTLLVRKKLAKRTLALSTSARQASDEPLFPLKSAHLPVHVMRQKQRVLIAEVRGRGSTGAARCCTPELVQRAWRRCWIPAAAALLLICIQMVATPFLNVDSRNRLSEGYITS